MYLKLFYDFDSNILNNFEVVKNEKYITIEGVNKNQIFLLESFLSACKFKLHYRDENKLVFKNKRIQKIAFHIYFFCVRGTSTALFDYAHYSESILGYKSIFVAPKSSILENKNVDIALKKFQKRFEIFYYDDMNDLENILEKEDCDMLYVIKYGTNDGIFSKKIKTSIHCVFDMSQKHGDVYAGVSEQIATKYGKSLFVPHMVMEPNKTNENLRNRLGIPDESTVFGYHGGYDSFNIKFAINAVKKAARFFPNIYFVFVNIPKFDNSPNIIFLKKIVEIEDKCKFINTCDCCLEAQSLGQSFGLSLADFNVNNKPIITYGGIVLNDNYKKILGNKAIYYYDENGLLEILRNFKKNDYKDMDLNCYKDYSPENVIQIFNNIFL